MLLLLLLSLRLLVLDARLRLARTRSVLLRHLRKR